MILQDDPEPSKCLGIFGLSLYTQERDLRDVFSRYGDLEECNVVYDRQSGRSRGFAFIYFRNIDDAIEVNMILYKNFSASFFFTVPCCVVLC